jgi:Ser/Thr protein kinase RdoA (MazF antagonist)
MKLTKKDFQVILKNYDIGELKKYKYLEHIHENNVYIIWTNKGKFILKDLINVNFDKYFEQLDFIDFLHKNKIKVALNIKTITKSKILNCRGKKIIIQEFKEGTHPKNFSKKLIKEIAENIAIMNKVSLRSKYKESKKKYYKAKDLSGLNIRREIINLQKENIRELNKFKWSEVRACRIHGDLCEVNILVKKDKLVSFIDFDDSNLGFIIYEIAIFIAHNFLKRRRGIDKKKIDFFIEEYEKIIKLEKIEKRALCPLIMYRLFGILYWYKKFYPKNKKEAKEFDKGIKRISDIIEIFAKWRVLNEESFRKELK